MRVQFQAQSLDGKFGSILKVLRDTVGLNSEWSHPEERELEYLCPSSQQSLVEDRLCGGLLGLYASDKAVSNHQKGILRQETWGWLSRPDCLLMATLKRH